MKGFSMIIIVFLLCAALHHFMFFKFTKRYNITLMILFSSIPFLFIQNSIFLSLIILNIIYAAAIDYFTLELDNKYQLLSLLICLSYAFDQNITLQYLVILVIVLIIGLITYSPNIGGADVRFLAILLPTLSIENILLFFIILLLTFLIIPKKVINLLSVNAKQMEFPLLTAISFSYLIVVIYAMF